MANGIARRGRPASARWLLAFVAAVVVALGLFAVNVGIAEVRSESTWGLSYGIAAAVLLVAVLALGVRRRTMRLSSRLGLGTARSWLYFHLYGGALFLLLVLMHSEFRLPSGWVTSWLWCLSLWTAVSGALGLTLQQWIPRVLASGLSTEVLYERIPELVDEVRERAAEVAAASGEAIQGLYEREVAPELVAPRWRPLFFFDITGGVHARLKEFRYLESFLSEEERERLETLGGLLKAKLEMDAHFTLQHALRVWLYLHVPTSVLLLVFVVIHVLSVLNY